MDNKDTTGDEFSSLNNTENETESTSPLKYPITILLLNGSRYNIEVDNETSILQIKEQITNLASIPLGNQRLIISGRILEDTKKVKDYNISPNQTIYLTKNVPANSNTSTTNTSTTSYGSQQPVNAASSNQDFNAPDSFMNSMLQGLMDRPEILRMLFDSNPLLSDLRERNPELSHILDDPQLIRQSMELIRNPALMREMTRTTDRAMSNIEAVPGGFNALRRMYQSFQEPLWNATMGRRQSMSDSGNSEDRPSHNYNLQTDQPPVSEALPNPWNNSSRSATPQTMGNLFTPTQFSSNSVNQMAQPVQPRNPLVSSALQPPSQNNSNNSVFPQIQNFPQHSTLSNQAPSHSAANAGQYSSTENSEFRFSTQLIALRDMGFNDTQRCIQALEQSGGNLNRAIDRLLNE